MVKKLISVLAFVAFANLFFFHTPGPMAIALQFIAAFFFLLVALTGGILKKQASTTVVGLFALTAASAVNIIRVGKEEMMFLSLLVGMGSLMLLSYTLATQLPFVRSLWELVVGPFRLLGGYLRGIGGVWNVFVGKQETRLIQNDTLSAWWPMIRSTLVGLAIGIPVVLVLLSMFGSADPIFAHATREFFSQGFLKNIPQRLLWSIVLFFSFAPIAFLTITDHITSPFSRITKGRWTGEMTVVMTLVALVVGSFLVVQWPYIFATVPAETDLSKFGVPNYSEYVKKGFSELLRIALVLYGLLWAGLLLFRDKKKTEWGILPYVQLVVAGELLFFIVSVFRRIWLYQLHHGWTLVRIYGGVFLLWLAGMVLFLAARHLMKKRWVIGEVVMTGIVVIGLGLFNVEHFIATTHPPTVNKRIDYVYLSRMSSDGYTGWQMALDHTEGVLTNKDLLAKPLLDKHDRREVAYAGTILGRLLQKQLSLLRWYGSEQEIRTSVHAIIDFEQSLHAQKLVPADTTTNDFLQKQREWFDEIRTKQDTITPRYALATFRLYLPMQTVDIADMKSYPHSFFTIQKFVPKPDTSMDAWNRWFSWNASEASAYQRMKEAMPITRLLTLQKAFIELNKKISNQSPEEQSYESDISFNAPFLE